MSIKVGMISLGCSKNQVDAEHMLARLHSEGFELCPKAELCDVVIVNTCGFIEDAKKESIENILEMASLKEEGRVRVIAATGCLAERYREELVKEMPEVDIVLGIGNNDDIIEAIHSALQGQKTALFGEKRALSLEGERVLANESFYAYLKVSEGCDNRCSYCAIPLIRGDFRSRRMEDIIIEAKTLAARGVWEINVVAQDTTRFGEDNYGSLMLPELLTRLCEIRDLHWVRLLYCYPDRITDELLMVMARETKIVKYMDIPVQHVSERVLKDMNRRGNGDSLRILLGEIRRKVPGIALRTTFITGFPGETEAEFEELCDFVKEIRFERLGCFAYSKEEDTPAALMADQIDDEIKRRRADIVMEIQMGIASELGEGQIGRELEVLCEGYDRRAKAWYGRSYMDAPDIDTKVFFTGKIKVEPGEFVQIKIKDTLDHDLIGTLAE